MLRITKKILCLFLALTMLACLLAGCQKTADPMAKSGFNTLTIDAKGRVNAIVTLDLRTVQAHAGQKAYLYELLPGEDITALASREPLDEAKVESKLQFRFPLHNGTDNTRIYSSFAVGFEDGTFLTDGGYWIENPALLAKDSRTFPWSGSPKGLAATDVDDAATLGAMHVMYEIRLSELLDGTDTISFGGESYAISNAQLSALDAKIIPACNAGMQVSLTVIPDTFPSYKAFAAVVDHLAARYTYTEGSSLTAIFIKDAESINTALLCRLANQALRSHVANGRVYVTTSITSLTEVNTFFATLSAQLSVGGKLDWGVAVVPQCSDTLPWEESADADTVTPTTLTGLSDALFTAADAHPAYFAVCGLSYSTANEDKQAASFAYAYRAAVLANAGLIFYGSHTDEANGLRTEKGDARRIVSLFSEIDTELSPENHLLCENLIGNAWTKDIASLRSRTRVSGVANVGAGGLEENILFDFTEGDTFGFTGVGSLGAPESHNSAAWDAPVLYTWINPTYENRGGVRKIFDDATVLEKASSLSVQLLTQIPDSERCTAYLRLEGLTESGARLTYESQAEIQNGTWQTVTYQIGNFIAEADLSRPCILTLTTETAEECEEEYVLWVKGMNVRTPSGGIGNTGAILLILAGVLVGFLAVFLIYRKTSKKHNRKRDRR